MKPLAWTSVVPKDHPTYTLLTFLAKHRLLMEACLRCAVVPPEGEAYTLLRGRVICQDCTHLGEPA